MIALAALILDLADSGQPATLAVGQPLVLRLACGPGEWWSFDVDPAILARDRLPEFEAHPDGATQVVTFHARQAGTTRLRGLRARGSGWPTARFEVTVEVVE